MDQKKKKELPHHKYAKEFFDEYIDKCVKDLGFTAREKRKWSRVDGKIAKMPLEEQAKYADIVTKRICDLGPEIVESYAKESLALWIRDNEEPNSCGIANFAYTITCLPEDSNLRILCLRNFNRILGNS
jgi:hypothetical protein